MYTWHFPERRRHRRVKIDVAALCSIEGNSPYPYLWEGRKFHGHTVDLSVGGTGVITKLYVPVDTEICVNFIIFEHDHSETRLISFYGQVRNIVAINESEYRIGISFGVVTEEIEQKYFELICLPHNTDISYQT